jgi:putative acetyltransferase
VSTDLSIAREDPRQPEIAALVEALDQLMASLYPAESNHLLDLDELAEPEVTFLVGRMAGHAAACGAYRVFAPTTAEIKRMWVGTQHRGQGFGRQMLIAIEDHARSAGIRRLKLETGIRQEEAIGLYEAQGYSRCRPFADYKPDPLSIFMTKAL